MRRDVRLLGDMLGEVISDAGGADLLADVERLRHAVIAARQTGGGGAEIFSLVSSWSHERAEQVARARGRQTRASASRSEQRTAP